GDIEEGCAAGVRRAFSAAQKSRARRVGRARATRAGNDIRVVRAALDARARVKTARCWRAARRGRPVAARCRVSRADEEVGSVSEGSRPSGAGARTARLPCDADRTLAAVLLRTGLMGRPHKTGES